MSIPGIVEARCLKLKAFSEARSVMTGSRKVSVGVGELSVKQRKRVLAG